MASLKTLALVLVLPGCGSLVDDRYLGPVQLRLNGDVQGGPSTLEPYAGKARLALFYFPRGPNNGETLDTLAEDESTSLLLDANKPVEWTIYDLPDDRHRVTTAGGSRYGFAVPYVYVDADGNGRHDPGEQYLGEAPVTAIVFAPDALDGDASPTGRALVTSLLAPISRPLWCAPRPAEPTERAPDCGVPLGSTCETNAQCGSGECLTNFPWPWPRGYCALPSSAACAPQNAHLWRSHRPKMMGEPLPLYWLPACESDRDCPGQPYRCDLANDVCLPNANLALRIDGTPPLPVCQP